MPVLFWPLILSETTDLPGAVIAMKEALADPGTLSPPIRQQEKNLRSNSLKMRYFISKYNVFIYEK